MPLIKIADELYYVQRAINNHQNADNSLAYMTYSDHTKASETYPTGFGHGKHCRVPSQNEENS